MVNFLSQTEEVNIPTGGEFTPSGIVSKWHGLMVYTFSTQTPLEPEHAQNAVAVHVRSGWNWYYFKDEMQAKAAVESADTQFQTTNLNWHFETQKADVLNFSEEAQLKFGDIIRYDVNVKSLGSTKYRHEYHMIALPSAVNAYATNLGYDTPGFDLSELIGDNPLLGTDDFHFKMIGHPDVKDESDPLHYTNSVLWKRRAELWASLGEPNAKAFRLMGAGTKFDTESPKLSTALEIANRTWTQAIWIKMVTAQDPRVGTNLSIPAIFEIYETKEDAQKAVASLSQTASSEGSPATSSVAVPSAWAEVADQWATSFAEFKTANPTLNAPTIAKAVSQLGVTAEEITAWYNA